MTRNSVKRKVYDRNKYIEERTKIMDYWGTICDSWLNPGSNVMPILGANGKNVAS